MDIKGRLLDQAMILFICIPFQMGTSLAPRGSEFFPLRAVYYSMASHFYRIKLPPLNVGIFSTHMRNLRNGFDTNDPLKHGEKAPYMPVFAIYSCLSYSLFMCIQKRFHIYRRN